MLIVCQKFRSCMLGHYIRSCHIIMHNMHETWGLIHLRTMRTLPTSCHVVLHVQWHHAHGACMQASWPPYVYVACQELLMDVPFTQAELYLSKLTASHFSTPNLDFANWNMLKRILIAMLNENKADCNENFRICAEEPMHLCTSGRHH